jgi:hypothetical protein
MRYARRLATIACGRASLTVWMVIRGDLLDHEVAEQGLEPIVVELSDEQVKEKYGVTTIYEVEESRAVN